jgi:hypothetical protein
MFLTEQSVAALCETHGITREAFAACVVEDLGGVLRVDTTHPAFPREQQKRPGLGDMVAAGLSAVGLTKERVSAALGRDCGCKGRQEALNAAGRRFGIG